MVTLFIILALFLILDMVALRWGVDSRERVSSLEWERRFQQEQSFAQFRPSFMHHA